MICSSCTKQQKEETKKFGNYSVRAVFSKGNIIDGKAEYYDTENRLVSKAYYQNGEKNGNSSNFYLNGSIKDSVIFVAGKPFGTWSHFDSSGQLIYANNYYYGLQVGPELFLDAGNLKKYSFVDFHRITIAECNYKNNEVDSLIIFKMNPVIINVNADGNNLANLFVYIPKIPGTKQRFSLGIIDEKGNEKEIAILSNNEPFIDTLINRSSTNWHYYVSCHIQTETINKVFVEEIVMR